MLSEEADWALLLVTLHRKRLLPGWQVVFLSCVSPESAKICLSLEVRKTFRALYILYNFEISLVVFKPNITTNHAITYTNATSDISKLLYVIARDVRRVKFETILKYHEWYYIYAKYHVQIMLLFVYTTTHERFVIFTCRYFK